MAPITPVTGDPTLSSALHRDWAHMQAKHSYKQILFFKKMLLNVPKAEGLSVGLFNLRLPLDPKSACLGLPNTAIRAFRTTSDFLLLCKKENVLSVSGSGQGGVQKEDV